MSTFFTNPKDVDNLTILDNILYISNVIYPCNIELYFVIKFKSYQTHLLKLNEKWMRRSVH